MEDLRRKFSPSYNSTSHPLWSLKRIWSYICKEDLFREEESYWFFMKLLSLFPFLSPGNRFQWDALENLIYVLCSVSCMPENSGEREEEVSSWQKQNRGSLHSSHGEKFCYLWAGFIGLDESIARESATATVAKYRISQRDFTLDAACGCQEHGN